MNEAEQANMAVFLSLAGVDVSLMNGLYEEVAYLTLSCSPAMWEVSRTLLIVDFI